MHLWQWTQNISKAVKQERLRVHKQADMVISSKRCKVKSIKQYPQVAEFLNGKFPEIDLSDVKIYLATPALMSKAGWGFAGGCYIHSMNVILLTDRAKNKNHKSGSKFGDMLNSRVKAKLEVEDILVHELIHAVSGKSNRSTRNFINQEEEFVFTNCIEFYKEKGMTDDDIVNNVFLPFCVQNVLNDRDSMLEILSPYMSSKEDLSDVEELLDKHARVIVSKVVRKGKESARQMIDSYAKYGCKVCHVSDAPLMDSNAKLASIDFD